MAAKMITKNLFTKNIFISNSFCAIFTKPLFILLEKDRAFIHGLCPQRERQIHTITLMFTIHCLPFTANGLQITPITFTDSLRSCQQCPLSLTPFQGGTQILWTNFVEIWASLSQSIDRLGHLEHNT